MKNKERTINSLDKNKNKLLLEYHLEVNIIIAVFATAATTGAVISW